MYKVLLKTFYSVKIIDFVDSGNYRCISIGNYRNIAIIQHFTPVNLSLTNFSILYALKTQGKQRFSGCTRWEHWPKMS